MRPKFRDGALERLETEDDPAYSAAVIEKFRARIQLIRSAPDERDFYALKSLHFERLKGDRSHQCSMRLNQKWRLILEFEQEEAGKAVVIVAIEDYH